MKHIMPLTLVLICAGSLANATCYADYKAKQDDPLRLQYGVAQITGEDCSVEQAANELSPKLATDGWTLLNVLGVFDESGLEERKESAGDNYLRY